MSNLALKNVSKVYRKGKKPVNAVNNLYLQADQNEFLAFLGPSGCGKSTTLRMIAGLEDISSGFIEIGGRVINDVHPKDRGVGLAFENYALYPPLTVYENIAFNLRAKGISSADVDKQVKRISQLLHIEELLPLSPSVLSGGQKQRVNIARAVVRQPYVLLLDEPLSHLDGKMRQTMRTELKRLHKEMNSITVIVTHDQLEAMALADKIAIINDGELQQFGTPLEVYTKPQNEFVAGFIGEPAMNFLEGEIDTTGGDVAFIIPKENIRIQLPVGNYSNSQKVKLGIRPAEIQITANHPDFQRPIAVFENLVEEARISVRIGNSTIVVQTNEVYPYDADDIIPIRFPQNSVHIFDGVTGNRLN